MMDTYNSTDVPIWPPPPGVMSNFDHPVTLAKEAHIALGICMGVTTLVLILRVYAKLFITHFWGWDDCMLPLL